MTHGEDDPLRGAAILFDLDGTLVDTAPDLAGAMNAVLSRIGLPTLAPVSVRPLVGKGARVLLRRGLDAAGKAASGAELDGLVSDFLDHYRRHVADASKPFPGCIEALDALADRGARLGVVTNKPEALSHLLLETLGMAERFACLIGGDTLATKKPDPEPVREARRRLLGGPGPAVLVGDSSNDADAARGAGAAFLLARFGYLDDAPDVLAPPSDPHTAVFDDYAALAPALTALVARAPARDDAS